MECGDLGGGRARALRVRADQGQQRAKRDCAHELEGRGFNVDRRKIELDQPLKALGEFDVPIKLHKEVTVHIKATVTKQDSEEKPA